MNKYKDINCIIRYIQACIPLCLGDNIKAIIRLLARGNQVKKVSVKAK